MLISLACFFEKSRTFLLRAFFVLCTIFYLFTASEVLALAPNDPDYSFSEPIFNQIGAQSAWDRTVGSRDIVVAVLDSGVDVDHPDLKDNIWKNHEERINGLDDDGNGYIDDYNGWDFVSKDNGVGPDTSQEFSETGIHHGTVVAGIIGAVGNNNQDSAGTAWKVRLMPLKVMDNHGSGAVTDVIEAIDYAVVKGADIINLSFSGPESSELLKLAMRRAYSNGVVVVVAAGNDNNEGGQGNLDFFPKFPVCTDQGSQTDAVIGVGAVDSDDVLADFSNFGTCIDLVAPGSRVASTVYHEQNSTRFSKTFDGYYAGTSLAAPLVSGAAALLLTRNPNWTPQDVQAALYLTSDAVDLKNPDKIGKIGKGRLNIGEAIKVKIEEEPVEVVTPPPTAQPVESARGGTIVAAQKSGGLGEVRRYDISNGFLGSFQPWKTIDSGVVFAVDDLDGDSTFEFVFVRDGEVLITDLIGNEINRFAVDVDDKRAPLSIALADTTGDGNKEILVTQQTGSRMVWRYMRQGFDLGRFVGSPENVLGLRIAAADITGDGVAEIMTTATGDTNEADVWVHLNDGNLYTSFQAFEESHEAGYNIAVGDIDGNGESEVIVARGPGASPIVRGFTFFGALVSEFTAFGEGFLGGVQLAAGDIDGDRIDDILVGAGVGGSPHVKIVDRWGSAKHELFAFDMDYRGGVNVGFYK